MTDLADFLLARIAEDEDAAKRAAFGWGATWHEDTDEEWSAVHADGQRDMVGCEDGDVTRHIALHDPARVLAECTTKAAIIGIYSGVVAARDQQTGLASRHVAELAVDIATQALRAAALPYATHPDYRQEWAP